jgi:tetratricopeptide (TPR) repeat protein
MALLTKAIDGLPSGADLVTWARLRLAAVSLGHRAGHAMQPQFLIWFDEAASVLRLTAIPIYQAQIDFIEAQISFEQGHFDKAKSLCEAVLARADVLSFRDHARAEMLLARVNARTGEPDEALRDLRAVAQRLDDADARDLSAEAWRLVAELALMSRSPGG